jgi:quercetin dioxygenase-like cupin family protein
VRAVVSTLGRRGASVPPERVLIEPGQMKLMYVLDGKVALQYNGKRHLLEAGDSAYLDGGVPHTWENVGSGTARTLWVITGKDA